MALHFWEGFFLSKYAFTLAALLAAPQALAGDQFTLGRTLLLGIGDSGATIPLLVCRPTKYVKVKAERGLTLERLVVTYGDDRTRTVRFDREMDKDQETQWQSLGTRRCVKQIQVYGNAEGSKAGVKVFGRR